MLSIDRAEKVLLILAISLSFSSTSAYSQRTLVISPPGLGGGGLFRFSADGRFIVFANGPALHRIRPDGSGHESFPVGYSLAGLGISGDGRLLTYTTPGLRIKVLDTITLAETEVSGPAGGYLPAISADGSTIAFVELNDSFLMAVDADGSNLREIGGGFHAEQGGPSLSQDGSLVVFVGDVREPLPGPPPGGTQFNTHLFTVGSDGSNLQQLTSDVAVSELRPRISADGQTILFQAQAYNFCPNCGRWAGDLFRVDAVGANLNQLTSGLAIGFFGEGPDTSALSADGSVAAFSASSPLKSNSPIFVVRTDGSGLRQIGFGGPDVTLDGRGSVVAYRGPGGDIRIWRAGDDPRGVGRALVRGRRPDPFLDHHRIGQLSQPLPRQYRRPLIRRLRLLSHRRPDRRDDERSGCPRARPGFFLSRGRREWRRKRHPRLRE